jgi:hypothetical protein
MVHVEHRIVVAFFATCVTVAGGCGSGNIDGPNAQPSSALIAEGAKAILKDCQIGGRAAMQVQFFGRRPHELLEYRLRPGTVGRAVPRHRSAHVVLYDYGAGLINERARDEQPYCPRR